MIPGLPGLTRPQQLRPRVGTTTPSDVAPTDIVFSASTIAYNALAGSLAFTVSSPGATGPLTWEIVDGLDGALFEMDGSDCEVASNLDETPDDTLQVRIRVTGPGGSYEKTHTLTVVDPLASFTMPIGIRNYGDAEVPAGSTIQFGGPIDHLRGLDPSSVTIALQRDSDSEPIPVQKDLDSTTRLNGNWCYTVYTAKLPFALSAETTAQCTLTVTPGGTYSGGSPVVSVDDLEALNFRVRATGDDISGTGYASFNDSVFRRQIKHGAVECGWEGWSRVKVSGAAQGQWGVRWRAMGKGADLSDWKVEATPYCCSVTAAATFPSGNRGRTLTTCELMSGDTVLNDDAAFQNVFVSGNTGFKMYADGDSMLPAYGGATLRPVHSRDYLVESKAIWPFLFAADDPSQGGVDSAALGTYQDAYVPGHLGGFRISWSNTSIDGTIGLMHGTSYNMLRNLSDDTKWRYGYDMGLKQLGVSMHCYDPATGYARPKFGSYSGLGAASHNTEGTRVTYSAAGATRMTSDDGHLCDTAFAPGLLTGEMSFIDGLHYFMARLASTDAVYYRPQCAGRDRREYPWITPVNTLTRYWDWPRRQLLHFSYLADDGRHDKAYAHAQMAQTQAFVQDLFVDKLQWTSRGVGQAVTGAHAGFNGSGSGGPYTLSLMQFNTSYSVGSAGGGDPAWSLDFAGYVDFLAVSRHGEAWIEPFYASWLTNYQIGRTFGPDACPAYSSPYYGVSRFNAATITSWADWQSTVSGDTLVPRPSCPSAASYGGGGYEVKYQHVCHLLDQLGFAGAHGHSYRDVVEEMGAVFGGSPSAVLNNSIGGRWLMGIN